MATFPTLLEPVATVALHLQVRDDPRTVATVALHLQVRDMKTSLLASELRVATVALHLQVRDRGRLRCRDRVSRVATVALHLQVRDRPGDLDQVVDRASQR